MFWKVSYVLDDGYDRYNRLCIIKADSKDEANSIFNAEIRSQLKGESYIIGDYTKFEECNDNTIIYDGSM